MSIFWVFCRTRFLLSREVFFKGHEHTPPHLPSNLANLQYLKSNKNTNCSQIAAAIPAPLGHVGSNVNYPESFWELLSITWLFSIACIDASLALNLFFYMWNFYNYVNYIESFWLKCKFFFRSIKHRPCTYY